nr:reverse transcriptase domain-containing protein [Tanacetum cinerariifolium]
MELVLEQIQQGSSHEVSVSTEGVEELKRIIRIKGVKKEALHTTLEMIRLSDKQHMKQIADQEVLYDKMSVQLVELDKYVRDLKNTVLEKDFKISELEECVRNMDLEIKKCLERLNVCENQIHKMGQTNQTVHMIMPSKDNLYNGQKGIGFEYSSYFEKAKDLRPTLYDEKVIGLENKIEFAYDYGNLNASYVNEKINFEDDYFQEIINPDFEKIDSPFQQTNSLKPYVPNVILEKIIIDLEDEVAPKTQNPKPAKETPLPKPYKLKIPYPQRLSKEKMEAQYKKFLEMICAIRINVPLVDVLAKMPNYGKFLKELISNKHKIEQISAAFLSDESLEMIQNKVSPKLGDPESFLISCNFNKSFSCNALADLGASINLMPYSLYAKLCLKTLKPTEMSVRLTDRSFQYPVRIAKNVLVEVGKFTFPADFVILEMEDDSKGCSSCPKLGKMSLYGQGRNCAWTQELLNRILGEIQAFSQQENESLTDAWLRMKEMLRNCHGHNLSKGNITKIFYQGLSEITQEVLNAGGGGTFLYKTPNQAYQLLEEKVLLKLDWAKNKKTKSSLKKTVSFTDEGSSNSDTDKIMARMDAMTLKIDAQYKELQSNAKKQNPILMMMTHLCHVKKKLNSCRLSLWQLSSGNSFALTVGKCTSSGNSEVGMLLH